MGKIEEVVVSRPLTYSGIGSQVTVEYIIWDVQSEQAAMQMLNTKLGPGATPYVYVDLAEQVTLYLADKKVDPLPAEDALGNRIFRGILLYTSGKRANQPFCVSEFDTTGGTINRQVAIRSIGEHTNDPVTRWHRGAINVTSDRQVEGVDVPGPSYQHVLNCRVPKAVVTTAYKQLLHAMSPSVNWNADFLDWHAGEGCFLGARGIEQEDHWDLTLHWQIEKNNETLVIGEGRANAITIEEPNDSENPLLGPAQIRPEIPAPYQTWAKLGWEHIWFWFDEEQGGDSDYTVPHATHVYIEQVLPYADHTLITNPLP